MLTEETRRIPENLTESGQEIYLTKWNAPEDPGVYFSFVHEEDGDTWNYLRSMLLTSSSGEYYDVGAFCRLFPRSDGNGYDITYGGSYGNYDLNYGGVVHKILDSDLQSLGEADEFIDNAGDIGIDTDGEYYYVTTASPTGWKLEKFDSSFEKVAEVEVELPEGHANNDQMVRVWNDKVFLSSLYDPTLIGELSDGPFTHLWVYSTDLEYISDVILDDAPNINGETIIYYDETYAHISANNFFTNELTALLYN